MRRLFCWQASALLLAATVAAAPVPSQNAQPADNSPQASAKSPAVTEPAPSPLNPGVTITGKPLHSEPPLPKLPPGEFMNCLRPQAGMGESQDRLGGGGGTDLPDLMTLQACELQMDWEKDAVLRDCVNLNGKTAPPRIIQACSESLDHDILPLNQRAFLFANRAQAYFALGYKQRALDDYDAAVKSARLLPVNEQFLVLASRANAYFALGDRQRALDDYAAAIKSAPRNAALYYNQGVVLVAQGSYDAALKDFDTALQLDSGFVPALRQRARLYATRGNLSGALADYSEAIRLQPKTARLWSDRGLVDLGQHAYANAVNDEAHAIQLDPKLASAYYLRSVALGDAGKGQQAVTDLRTAIGLDPSLANYVTITGKTVVLKLPPL